MGNAERNRRLRRDAATVAPQQARSVYRRAKKLGSVDLVIAERVGIAHRLAARPRGRGRGPRLPWDLGFLGRSDG